MPRIAAALAALLLSMPLFAQTYPMKPINIIVPLGAGSTVDIIARVVGAELTKSMGQPVTVELLPGAGGTIGTAKAAKSAPDGYTITIASNGTHAINMGLYLNPGYDPIRDFAPIALVGAVTNVMIVHPSNPAFTPQDVAAAARVRPGELSYASGGVGTTHHFSGVMFASMANLKLEHVPFKASLDGINQVIAGKVTMGFFNMPTVLTQIREGKLKALAVTSKTRSNFLPQLPTLDEAGLAGYEVTAWFGFAAPAGTPAAVIERLNAEINKVMVNPEVRDKLVAQGFEIARPDTPAAFGKLMRDDLARWLPIVKASGAVPQ
jgi:tripartite-type tricarboxylate transporter receptor subunit TctC